MDNIAPISLRFSGIELLRIVAMILVLITHLRITPSVAVCQDNTLQAVIQYFIGGFSCCCVPIFVLISGWFGIRPKVKSFVGFIFHCLYFLLGVYIVCVILGLSQFNISGLLHCFLFVPDWDYWFIKCYILLYVLSPMLNAFADNTTEKTFSILYGNCQLIYEKSRI